MNVFLNQTSKPIVNVDQFVFEFLLQFHSLFAFVARLFAGANERLQTFATRVDTLSQLVSDVRRQVLTKTIGELRQFLQLMFGLLNPIEQRLKRERCERCPRGQTNAPDRSRTFASRWSIGEKRRNLSPIDENRVRSERVVRAVRIRFGIAIGNVAG